jgi:hypothetical protein
LALVNGCVEGVFGLVDHTVGVVLFTRFCVVVFDWCLCRAFPIRACGQLIFRIR